MIVHYYTSRKHRALYKVLCSEEPIAGDMSKRGPWNESKPANVTSTAAGVTCRKCLELLLPKAQAEVDKIKAKLGVIHEESR